MTSFIAPGSAPNSATARPWFPSAFWSALAVLATLVAPPAWLILLAAAFTPPTCLIAAASLVGRLTGRAAGGAGPAPMLTGGRLMRGGVAPPVILKRGAGPGPIPATGIGPAMGIGGGGPALKPPMLYRGGPRLYRGGRGGGPTLYLRLLSPL